MYECCEPILEFNLHKHQHYYGTCDSVYIQIHYTVWLLAELDKQTVVKHFNEPKYAYTIVEFQLSDSLSVIQLSVQTNTIQVHITMEFKTAVQIFMDKIYIYIGCMLESYVCACMFGVRDWIYCNKIYIICSTTDAQTKPWNKTETHKWNRSIYRVWLNILLFSGYKTYITLIRLYWPWIYVFGYSIR